jgi:hypothetical protein
MEPEADDSATETSPISCVECGSINWSMGDCRNCGKALALVEQTGDTPPSRAVEPVVSNPGPEARAAAESEARKKAMEDPEIRRKMLRSKIRAMQSNRSRLTYETEVRDKRGRRVRGARQERQPQMTFTEAQAPEMPSVDVSAPDLV